MRPWRHLAPPECGYPYFLSEAASNLQQRVSRLIWPVNAGVQLIFSDYSGQHKGASHEIYAFLVTTDEALKPWISRRAAFRKQWLPDSRRLSFKQLREPLRRRAYPHFLALAGEIRANLLIFMIDNRVGSFIDGGPAAAIKIFDDCFEPTTPLTTVEKMLRLATLLALIETSLRDERQFSQWISDHDETLATFQRREGFARLATYLTFGLTGWQNSAEQGFSTTESSNLPEWVEDIAAIPDIAAGAVAQMADVLPTSKNRPTWITSLDPSDDIDWRAKLFGSFLSKGDGDLRHIIFRLAPDINNNVKASAQAFTPPCRL